MRFTIWLLYIIEFADWDSQEKIGYGCGSNSTNGTSVGTPSNGFLSAFRVRTAEGFPLFIPTVSSGGNLIYSCDERVFDVSHPCVYVGSYYYQNTYHGTSYAYAYIGCRLQELP